MLYTYSHIEDFSGRTVKGTVLRYGEEANDYRAHIYEPDSMAIQSGLILNRMHDKSVRIIEPEIQEYDDRIAIAATLA